MSGLAFLGCGQAARMHSSTLSGMAPDWPRFYASRDADRGAAFSDRYGGAGSFVGYEAALDDDRIATVMVVTPPASHLRWTLAALDAGKDVIVEKPAFTRATDFDDVETAAKEAGRRVLVAENYAYKPLVEDLRWLFDGRPLGRLLFLHVNALKYQKADGWRADRSQVGGGALLEGGIHWVSLLARAGPAVASVRALSPSGSASSERSDGVAPPERSIHLLLEYEQGTVASLSYSWEVDSPLKGLRISRAYGTDGTATFESNGLFFLSPGRPWRARIRARDLLGYGAMFRDFRDSLLHGRSPRFTLANARRDVELVEAAYRDAGLSPSGPEHDAAQRDDDSPTEESRT